MDYIEILQENKTNDIKKISTLIINTIKAKALYSRGGWSAVREELKENEYFNPNFGISATLICMKLREIGYKNSISVQSNMLVIEKHINKTLGIKAIEYCVDRKNHFFRIKLG
jgi:hypothetical protein